MINDDILEYPDDIKKKSSGSEKKQQNNKQHHIDTHSPYALNNKKMVCT